MAVPLIGAALGAAAGYLSFGTSLAFASTLTGAIFTGASYGVTVAGMLFPPPGPNTEGPKLEDTSVTLASYGAIIPRVYGTMPVSGTMVWVENDKLKTIKKKQKSGGKGGGGGTYTTYQYAITCAVALADTRATGAVLGARRIWLAGKLVYDGASATTEGVIVSGKARTQWKLYTGTDTQAPDPRYQTDVGAAAASGWSGLCYIVFYDLNLTKNKIAHSPAALQPKVELVMAGTQGACPVGIALSSTLPLAIASSPTFSVGHKNGILRVGAGGKITRYTTAGVKKGVEKFYPTDVDGYGTATPAHNDPDSWWGALYNGILGAYWYALVDKGVPVPETWGGTNARSCIRIGNRLFGITAQNTPVQYRKLWAVKNGLVDAELLLSSTYSVQHVALTTDDEYLYVTDNNGTYEYDSTLTQTGFWAGIKIADASHGGIALCAIAHRKLYGLPSGLSTAIYTLNDDGSYTQSCVGGDYPAVRPPGETWWVTPTKFFAAEAPIIPSQVTLGSIVQAECLQSNLLTAGDLDVTSLTDLVSGFRVSDVAPIRSALGPLQSAWPFDIRLHGYQLQFVRRGTASVASIPAADLDARAEGENRGPLLTVPREMDTQLPRKVTVKHLDPAREYDIGEQYAQRDNTDAVNVVEVDLAMALTPTEAKRAAEVLLYSAWRERGADIACRLPPTYGQLEPADVVTVTDTAGAAHVLRLANINTRPSGILECVARREAPTSYTSTAATDGGLSTGGELSAVGPTFAVLMDLPCLQDADNQAGFYAAVCGATEVWDAGYLAVSADLGQSWSVVEGFDTSGTMGTVDAPLGAANTTTMVDASGTLTVGLWAGELASVTLLEMLAGANHFAYGADGRWEILAAQTVTLNGDGTYTLQDFLRGRLGTEQYTATHQAGDMLVLLDANSVTQITIESATIGQPRLYRAITEGEDIDSDQDDLPLTCNAVNLEPLSPVYLNGSRHPTSGDWTITVVPRYRINTDWRDSVDVAEDEATTAFEMDIYTDGSYAAVMRTIAVTSPSFSYSYVDQLSDLGTEQSTLYTKTYKLSAAVGRGHPLIGSLSDPRGKQILGLLMDGTNGSQVFTETTGKTVTANGNVNISTAQSYSGGASGYWDGTGDYLAVTPTAEFAIGLRNFFIRFYARPDDLGSTNGRTFIDLRPTATNGVYPVLAFGSGSDGKVRFGTPSANVVVGTSALPTGAFTKIEISRHSGVTRLLINDIEEASGPDANNYLVGNVWIGRNAFSATAPDAQYKGFMDAMEIWIDASL